MESLKNCSRLASLVVAIVFGVMMYISAMNPDDLAVHLGVYGNMAPVIIVICGFIVSQYSEEVRVKRAEELVHREYGMCGQIKEEAESSVDDLGEGDLFGVDGGELVDYE